VIQNFFPQYFTGGDEPLPLSGYMANELKKYRALVGSERERLLYDGKVTRQTGAKFGRHYSYKKAINCERGAFGRIPF